MHAVPPMSLFFHVYMFTCHINGLCVNLGSDGSYMSTVLQLLLDLPVHVCPVFIMDHLVM